MEGGGGFEREYDCKYKGCKHGSQTQSPRMTPKSETCKQSESQI